MLSLKFFLNLSEIYSGYPLFHIGDNQNPSRQSRKGDTLWSQKKKLSFLEKFKLNKSLKQKVQHDELFKAINVPFPSRLHTNQ